jgi:hypothetical protein
MNRIDTLAEIRDYSAYALSDSDLADCGSPDTRESAGALLLTRTRDAFLEFIDSNPEATADDIREDISTITGDMVSIYTHERWQQFVDLAAYQEESETGEWPTDLNDTAAAALYQIIERMVFRFADMIEKIEEDEDDDA